MDYQDADH